MWDLEFIDNKRLIGREGGGRGLGVVGGGVDLDA